MPKGVFEKIIEFTLLGLIFWRPFFSGIVYPWSCTLTQILVLALALLWLLKMTFAGEIRLHRTLLDLPILAFFLVAVTSTLTSVNLHSSLSCLYRLTCYLLAYYLIINNLSHPKKIQRASLVILAGAFLIALYGIYQYRFGLEDVYRTLATSDITPQELADIKGRILSRRVFATFILPSNMAGYLGMVIPLGIGCFLARRSRAERILLIIVIVTMMAALGATKSIGGILSLVVGIALGAVLMKWGMRKVAIFGVLLLLTICIGFFFVYKEGELWDPSSKVTLRLYNWKGALEIIKDHPFTGTGMGTFGTAYLRYKAPQANETQFAHNWYLQSASEMGLLGLVALLWLLIILFKNGARTLMQIKGDDRWIAAGLLTGLGVYALHNLIDMDSYIPGIQMLFWVMAGLLILTRTEKPLDKRIKTIKRKAEGAKRWATSLIIALAILGLIFFVIKPYLARLHFSHALIYDRENRIEEAISEFKEALRWDPSSANYHSYLARAYLRKNELTSEKIWTDQAVDEYQEAIRLDPHNSFLRCDLGQVYHATGQLDKAADKFREAITCYPNYAPHRFALSATYKAQGKSNEAAREHQKATALLSSK